MKLKQERDLVRSVGLQKMLSQYDLVKSRDLLKESRVFNKSLVKDLATGSEQ